MKFTIRLMRGELQPMRVWLEGLIAAALGAAGNGITVVLVDPNDFNLDTGLAKLTKVVVVSAIMAIGLYLKQKPLPIEAAPIPTGAGKLDNLKDIR